MSKLVVFIVIMLISLLVGGAASGIYVAVIRNRDEEHNKQQALVGGEQTTTSVAPVVSFIMITSALLGLLVFGIYYLVTMEETVKPCPPCAKCAKCVISEDDFVNLRKAEREIVNFQEKANLVPDIAVQETCSKRSPGIGGGTCGNFFKQSPVAGPVSVPITPGEKAVLSPQGIPYIPIKPAVKESFRLERPVQAPANLFKDRLKQKSPNFKIGGQA